MTEAQLREELEKALGRDPNKRGAVRRSDIETMLNCGRDKAHKIVRALVAAGWQCEMIDAQDAIGRWRKEPHYRPRPDQPNGERSACAAS